MRLLGALIGFSFLAATGLSAAGLAPGPLLAAAPSQFATTGATRIHYKVLGHGSPTIVFLHGLGGNMNVWREQVAALHTRARLILIDLPGHGGSDLPSAYSIRDFARAVSSVLKQTRSEHAILIGHSLGALVARDVDRYYPAHCRAVVSVDGMLQNPLPDADAAARFVASFTGDDGSIRLGRFYDGLMSTASPDLRDDVRATALATPRAALLGTLSALLQPEVWSDARLSVPLYAVVARDAHIDDAYLQHLRSLGNDVTVDVLENTDHYLMLDDARDFNVHLEAWLAAHQWIK